MLTLQNLEKSYGRQKALAGVSLQVEKGEIVVLMGPSGCGKSTTIRCINRLTEPDSGDIVFEGKSVLALNQRDVRAIRQNVGFVFQQFNLIARLNVVDNVMFHLVLGGMEEKRARLQAHEALNRVGLSSSAHKRPSELSGGQQQRVGIARALVGNPRLMLWDEPTASLDPMLVGEVLEVMEELATTTKTTMIIVTHEVSFALKVAHRIVLMDRGVIVEEGSPERVFGSPISDVGVKYSRLLAV